MSRITNKYSMNATARDMAVHFSLPGVSQFPPEGIEEPIIIQGHQVWVDPKHPTKRMSIRTMTRCLDCGKVIQVGRLGQHDRVVHKGIKPRNQNRPKAPVTVIDDQGRAGEVTGPRCSFCTEHGVADCSHQGM